MYVDVACSMEYTEHQDVHDFLILHGIDDDEALSGDKDDVVFVDMTPVRVRPSRVKNLNLMPISIDSDDEDEDDDDIIFVSATTGKRKSRMGSTQTLPSPTLPVSDQALLNVLESIDNPSRLTASQSLPQDLLASSDTEHSTSLLLGTPKLPPGQPSFHDSSNYVDDTDGPSHLGRMRSAQTDASRLSALDPDSTLSAFLAGDTTPPAVDTKSSLGTWPETSSEQQGLLAWLSNLSVPANLGLDDASESAKVNTGDQAGTAVAGSTASTNTTSSPLSSFQKVDSWLSTMPPASKLDDRKVVTAPDPLAASPTSPWLSYLSASGQVTSASLDTNTTSSPSGLTSLVTSLLSTVSDAFQSPVFQTAGVHTSTTDTTGAPRPTPRTNSSSNDSNGGGGGATAKDSTNTSPNESFTSSSLTSSPSSLSTGTLSSVQSSGATSPSSPRVRISLRPHASVTRNKTPSPPVATINLTGESCSPPRPQPGGTNSITPSSNPNTGSTVSTVAQVAPIVICPQSDDDTTSSTNNTHMATSSQEVTSTTQVPTVSRSSSHANFTDTSIAKPSPSTPETGASSSLLKRSVSYMQTHPNNIPLKKRRRQRAVGRLSLDSVDTRGGGSSGGGTAGSGGENTDSRKCSWCQLMVAYSHLSHCMEGHPCCADCLQLRAKALLSKSKRGSLKCPYASCVSYFPMSQLQRTLPSMVVEILEEKLDQEYIKYADDLMWQNLGEGATGADGDGTLADDEEEEEEDEDDAAPGGDRGSRPSIPKQPTLSALPVFWEQMDDVSSGFKMVELSSDNIEYTEISCLFNSTMKSQATIQRICRVQNPILWQFYNVKKLQLQEAGGEPVQEKQLCHGTSNNVVDAICKNNFDWRLCGAHGTMYGQGTYFARDASYSHVYTDNVRTRSLQNPGHILAMLNKTKKVRSHICLKHLAGQQSVNTGSAGGWPGVMNIHNQPPPAHWKQPPQVSVSLINMAQSPVISQTQAVSNQSLLVSQTNSTSIMSSIVQSGAAVALGMSVLGPTVGSTSTGNSGLNLTMPRPLTISTTPSSHVHKPPSFHRLLHAQPVQPPPAHLRRAHQHSASGSVPTGSGTCGGHRSMSHYYNKRRSLFSTATEVPLSPQKRPIHSMFIAKVLVGRYTNGHNHYRKPPPVDHNDPYGRAYDSCVDDMRDPKIYVIFDSAQSYPEYLIEYHSNSSYM